METRNMAALNMSPSKHQFSFQKSPRFPSPLSYTDAFGYEIPGQFDHKKSTGAKKSFGIS